jgi:hypothetical protein
VRRERLVGLLRANPWRTLALGLATLLALTLVLSGGEKNSEPRPKPKTLALTLEKKFSRQVDRVEQDLRPVMAEQGAEGTTYRVKEGSTSCREQDGGPSLVCLVWLIDGEGTTFSLTYSLTSADGSCWEATPDGAKLADGRPVPIDRAKLPPLDYCLDPPASPAPSERATDADSACDPSYPDFCILPPPPDRNCPDLSQKNFTVRGEEGDPHGFDADGDGRGCDEPAPEKPKPAEARGPTGPLGTSSVGPVNVGMPSEQVEGLFGRPERKEEVNLGQGPAPQVDWIWTFDDGEEFRLQFETEKGTVTGYVSDTSELATKSGVKVGDPFSLIRDEYGGQLEESMVGEGSYLLSEGEPASYPALTFSVEEETITSIGGGAFQPAGE